MNSNNLNISNKDGFGELLEVIKNPLHGKHNNY